MADIRIKDITTTASASLTGDFLPIDGTTGTRKLSAFSPTFGGNATVTGTLTANGTITANSATGGILVNGAGITMDTDPAGSSASLRFVDGATPRFWIYKLSGDSNLYFRDMTNGRMQLQMLPGATSSTAISTFNSILSVTSTSASTSTSSGALVVGNGTSGGLGVGGAIVAGGTITSTASTDSGLLQLNLVNSSTGTSASSLFRFNAGTRTATLQAYNDTHATLAGQLRVGTSNGDIVLIPSGVTAATFGASSTTIGLSPSSTDALFSVTGTGTSGATKVVAHLENNFGTAALNNAAQLRFKIFNNSVGDAEFAAINGITDSVTAGARTTGLSFLTGQQTVGLVERMRISGAGVVSITSSAISSNTSSGALVVSGGVGVAKQLYVGGNVNSAGDLTVEKTEPIVSLKRAADTNLNLINLWTGVNADFGIGLRNTSDSDLHIYNYGTSNDALKIAKADSLATFGGAVRTAAPSGGTAANWKLGTVATVSPTSPNRTIEVDIGGTIYYIHAKTTNN